MCGPMLFFIITAVAFQVADLCLRPAFYVLVFTFGMHLSVYTYMTSHLFSSSRAAVLYSPAIALASIIVPGVFILIVQRIFSETWKPVSKGYFTSKA